MTGTPGEYAEAAAIVWGYLLLGVLVIGLLMGVVFWLRRAVRAVRVVPGRRRASRVAAARRRYTAEALEDAHARLREQSTHPPHPNSGPEAAREYRDALNARLDHLAALRRAERAQRAGGGS